MSDLYPRGEDQFVDDDRWIGDVSDQGWLALTKDTAIVRDHARALRSSTIRLFTMGNANLSGPQMAARIEENLARMLRRARRPGPFVDVIHADRIERRWSP